MNWYKSDPRDSFNKRGTIIVAIPEDCHYKYYTAHVETKNAYSVFFDSKEIYNYAGEDEWNKEWLWTYEPSEFNIETNVKKWWED